MNSITGTHSQSNRESSGSDNQKKKRILVVDDDGMIRGLLKDILEPRGYIVDVSEGSGSALEKLIDYKYNVMLLDANLPGISGYEILKYCKKHHPFTEIIMITGQPKFDAAVSTVKDGAFDYIPKPFEIDNLLSRIRDAIEHQEKKLSQEIINTSFHITGGQTANTIMPEYKIIKTLGAGSMGVVLLVEKDNRQYAMKILRKESEDEAYKARVKRFLREAEVLSKINHPNVVKIYKYGYPLENDVPFILMEYIAGEELTSFIKNNVLELSDKLCIIKQIASALDVVHRKKILHRDIKPGNILVKENLLIKLTDFGIARIADSSLTMTSEALGSPAYMAPECFDPKIEKNHTMDIFSLGVLSYELITGVKPFYGESIAEIMSAIQNSKPIAPRKYVPNLPYTVEDLLAKMLNKRPQDRFQSAAEIVEIIDNILEGKYYSKNILRNIFSSAKKVWE